MKGLRIAALALSLAAPAIRCNAAESVNLILNWTPTADHSPFYYAKAQGWYEKAGIDLTIETGKGSGVSSLKVGSGGSPFGIADLATMLVAKSKGADVVALMSIYANTGQTFYWLKSYGVNGPKDFPNHKIGNRLSAGRLRASLHARRQNAITAIAIRKARKRCAICSQIWKASTSDKARASRQVLIFASALALVSGIQPPFTVGKSRMARSRC